MPYLLPSNLNIPNLTTQLNFIRINQQPNPMRKPLLFILALLASVSIQTASAQQFVASAKNGSTTAAPQAKYLKEVLGDMQSRYQTAFIYKTNLVETATVSSSFEMTGKNLEKDLRNALEGNNLAYQKAGQNLFVITAKEIQTAAADDVTGRVKDAKTGEALPGVSILVKGTTRGTTTDANGNYKIAAGDNATLVYSFVGYDSKEIVVAGRTAIDVALESSASTLGEVQVVGSRSTTARTNIESAAPVDVITPKELKGFSQVDVGQILNYVAPSFNSNRQTVADGTDHIDPASLRGLGPDQVLVLVNGKRRHTSALVNINGTVGRGSVGTDMNVIPVAAIERIEVLRDGAAAQYGSDAIAGVINVVLKKDYKGLTASFTGGTNMTTMKYTAPNINGGVSDYSKSITDGQVIQFDISKGLRLGKNGAMSISAQYNERGKTSRTGLDNVPTIYLGANAGFPGTPTGQDATTFRKTLLAADAAQVSARGYNRENMVFGNSNSRNIGLFINGGLPVGVKSEVYFSGGITSRTGQGYGNNRIPVSRGQQPLAGDGSLLYQDGFLPGIESTIGDLSLQLGFKTNIAGFKMDLSNTYGANTFKFGVFNSGNATLPNSDTQQKTFDAGKLQFTQNTTNLDFARMFDKVGSITGLNVAFGAEFRTDHYQITAGEVASYSGADKKVNPAPLTVGGAPYGAVVAAGPGSQVFPGYQPTNQIDKSRTNLGLYGDLEGEFAKRLLVGVAARFENYSDFGSNVTGKIAGRLKLTDNFALRGSASTGFRAPSLHQRYFNNTSTQFVSGIPSNTLTVNNEDGSLSRVAIGVDALKPETSVNFTAGVTAKLGTLSLTIDAYKIDIKDRIVYSGAFSRALLGFTADQYVGINNVNFFANAANTSTQGVDIVANGRYNIGKGKLLVTLAMNFNENKVTSINSTPLINSDAKNDPVGNPNNWFKNLLFDRQQISRIEVWQPKDKINLSLTYSIGNFDITARTVRFGAAKYVHNVYTEAKKADGTYWSTSNNIAGQPQPLFNYNADGTAKIDQTFAPVFISDLIVNYKINKMLGIAVGANNIFDVYPDQIYIDPRNAVGSVDYASGRDASNRGRLLFQPNQGGYNGRFVFARLTASF
jgi:iron complex outermembrane receptor protein